MNILLVEDDIETRFALATALREVGFIVREAATADEAMCLLTAPLDIQAVVTDVDMPGEMDGLKLAAHVQANAPGVCVVVVSGNDVSRKVAPLGVDFLQKPFTLESLIQRLKVTQ